MTDPLEWCADLVAYACRDRHVHVGWSYQPPVSSNASWR